MTNGEKILQTFPHCRTETHGIITKFIIDGYSYEFSTSWWNAEYKEPTTKNEAKYCDRNICLKNEYNNIGCEDCEVTKSQEPTTKNDLGVDCISRADALDCVNWGYSLSDVYKKISDLPSVTPQEPRKGHWTYRRNEKGNWENICSNCGLDSGVGYPYPYCPSCGAKMESEGKE